MLGKAGPWQVPMYVTSGVRTEEVQKEPEVVAYADVATGNIDGQFVVTPRVTTTYNTSA
jgi:hypothetical protein